MPQEKTVVRNILRYLNKELADAGVPAFAHKTWGGPQTGAGEPDIDACVAGRCVKIEVKAPGREGRVTDLQAHRLGQWRRAGAVAGVASSVEDVRTLLADAGLV